MLSVSLFVPVITIVTPTWNRRHLLPRLYQSMEEQRAPEGSFEWLVVDDGSEDGTSDWLRALIPDSPFPIRLIRQENGGKHRALNRAAQEVTTPWLLIVDSDDHLLPDAIRQILEDTTAVDEKVKGIVAPLDLAGFDPRWFKVTGKAVDYAEWYAQRGVGDTSIVMRSYLLRENPFPEYEGERFVTENTVWARIFSDGGVLFSSSRIVRGEYQADGLSARGRLLWLHNPLGAMASNRSLIEALTNSRLRRRFRLNYHRLFWHAKRAGRDPRKYGFEINLLWIIPGFIRYSIDRLKGRRSQ